MDINPLGDDGFPPLTPEEIKELKEVEKLLNKSRKLNPKPKKHQKSVNEKQKEYEIISRFLSEYMDSYVLLGFNTTAEDMVIMKYNNPMERRALTHLIDEFFSVHFDQLSNNNPVNPDDEDDENQGG